MPFRLMDYFLGQGLLALRVRATEAVTAVAKEETREKMSTRRSFASRLFFFFLN